MSEQFEENIFPGKLEAIYDPAAMLLSALGRIAAGAGLFLLSPLLLVCAGFVKAGSHGPVFFRQPRVGRNGELFTLYKFRTMAAAGDGLPFAAENDRRVTRAGRFLRKTKIDELPQLYNVLRGEMSFVGPRPEVPELVDAGDPRWQMVLRVCPGITDPVTVRFRNEGDLLSGIDDKLTFYRETIQPFKLNGYLDYLEKKSLKNDLTIIVQTFGVIVSIYDSPPITLDEIRGTRGNIG